VTDSLMRALAYVAAVYGSPLPALAAEAEAPRQRREAETYDQTESHQTLDTQKRLEFDVGSTWSAMRRCAR
jgi:hypothetical protein